METDRDLLMLRAAHLYYYERLTQSAIADRMNTTRWTVGRLLEEAREIGMVTISINHPRARTFELEEKLQKAFSLGDAVVVNTQATPEATSQLVASSAAEYLTGLRPKPRTIGVAWGKTSAGVALAMPERWTNDLRVYQTYGGLVRSNDDVVSHSIGLMAKRGQGVGYMVPAPAIVADERLGTYLMREPAISQTLVHAAQAEILLYSPGVLGDDSVLVKSGFLTTDDVAELQSRGCVTDLFSHFIGADGKPVDTSWEARTVAISLDAVRRAKNTSLVASGDEKVDPVGVSVCNGYAKVLVTDSRTAEQVLERYS